MNEEYLEIETKYDASGIDRAAFKQLVSSLGAHKFRYAESTDIYYTKSENEFLRYRMPCHTGDPKAELTFKKKHKEANNNVRTEVNLRVDANSPELVKAFCEGIGYQFNFSIVKFCDIYVFDDGNVAFYTVIDEAGKAASFIEIEANEYQIGNVMCHINGSTGGFGVQPNKFSSFTRTTQEQGWAIVQKYEKLLAPLGISAQKRMKLSLFERYKKAIK